MFTVNLYWGGEPAASGPNLAPVNINMDRIRIFVTQAITQHRVKMKLHDKHMIRL